MLPDRDVAQLPLFAGFSGEEIERLCRNASIRRCPVGTVLFEERDQPDHLHVLISGVVELYTSYGSHDCGILLLSAGDVFMPAATLFSEPYLNSARVLGKARVLLLDADVAREEFARCGEFATRMARTMAGHFRMAARHIIDLKCRSAGQRLGAFLLRLVDESDAAVLPIPKRNLAVRVGMTAETLSRTLQLLADNGLHLRGNRILVKDRAKAEAFCGPEPYSENTETALGVHAL